MPIEDVTGTVKELLEQGKHRRQHPVCKYPAHEADLQEIVNYFGVDSQHYGWLFAVNIVGVMTVSFINRNLVKHYSLDNLLKATTSISMLALVLLAVSVKAGFGGISIIFAMVFIFFWMNGIIAASATAAALDEAKEVTGSASALIGSLQYGSGIVSSLLLAAFQDGTPWPMAWVMALFAMASAATVVFKPSKTK